MFRMRFRTEVVQPATSRERVKIRVPSGRVVSAQVQREKTREALRDTTDPAIRTVLPTRELEERNVQLSAGSATAAGVTVERVRVGPEVRHVVIDRSRAVQVGDHNRQLNRFRYRIDRPQLSADNLLGGDRARLRAFENFVQRPNSMTANWAFRHRLSMETRSEGRVRIISTSAPGTRRVTARLDERGDITVNRSSGVQVGSGNTQRNEFRYRLAEPEISLGPMLRDNPRLARDFALAARHQGNAAVQRSFSGRLARAYAGSGRSFAEHSDLLSRTTGLGVYRAVGVQFGTSNIRTDRIDVSLHRVALTGWPRPDEALRSGRDRLTRPPGALDRSSLPAIRELDSGSWAERLDRVGSESVERGWRGPTVGRPVRDDDPWRPESSQRSGRSDEDRGRFGGGDGRR